MALNVERKVSQRSSNVRQAAWLVVPPPLRTALRDELEIPPRGRFPIVESSSVASVPPPPVNNPLNRQRLTVSGDCACSPPLS